MTDHHPSLDRPSRSPDEIARLTAEGIAEADRRLEEGLGAALASGSPSFEAVFGPLDDAARIAADTFGRGGFLREVAPEEAVRAAASDAVDALEQWKAELPQRPLVVAAVAAVAGVADPAALDPDQAALLRNWQEDIRLAGAKLAPAARDEVKRLQARLIELQGQFIGNLGRIAHLDATQAELAEVPPSIIAGLAPGSAPDTLDVPINDSVTSAILESAANRDLRERVARASLNKGMPGNRAILDEAVSIRRRLAGLLGAPSWLALRAARFAAGTPEAIVAFLDDMEPRLRPLADAERAAMRDVLLAEPGSPTELEVEEWDWRHADAIQRRAAGVDPDELRAYLPYERVFAGLREVSEAVFGVRLEDRPERAGWHPDVRAFDMVDRDSGEAVAHLFIDPFVRLGKQPGAFQGMLDMGDRATGRPRSLLLVTNVPDPANGPSLLGVQEVDMLFHEYGHALESALEQSPYVLHRFEHWVPMDWVEGPSQFLGRYGLHPEVLAGYARHHETGEPVPAELLAALQALEPLNAATRSLRYLAMGRLDVLLHGEEVVDLGEANRTAMSIRGTPVPEDAFFPAGLIHLLSGYEGAIYGFVWSQVLRDDLLSRFEEQGMRSPEVGAAYREHMLERPWTRDPLSSMATFLGRPWSSEAFFARVRAGARLGGSPVGGGVPA